MAETKPDAQAPHLPERAEEARNLATEALEEHRQGNKEEADFLINEARRLDPDAARETLKQNEA